MSKEDFAPEGDERSAQDTELATRLNHLKGQLAEARADHDQRRMEQKQQTASISGSAMAFGLRLSSAFVGSVLVGAAIGWGIDHFLPTSPWGLIVFVLIGFVAGLVNLIKAAGTRRDNR